MSGIVPNTLDSELNPPGRETTIIGNLVIDNKTWLKHFLMFATHI